MPKPPLIVIPSVVGIRRVVIGPLTFHFGKLRLKFACDRFGQLILDGKDVSDIPVVRFRPYVIAGSGLD